MYARLFVLMGLLSVVVACSSGSANPGSVSLTPNVTPNQPVLTVGSAPGTIVEFPLSGDTLPQAITVADDSNAWFLSLNHVNKITPEGVISPHSSRTPIDGTGSIFAQYSPEGAITVGPDHAIWFTGIVASPDTNPVECSNGTGLGRIAADAATGALADLRACIGTREHGDGVQTGVTTAAGDLWTEQQNNAPLGSFGGAYSKIATNGTILVANDFPSGCGESGGDERYFPNGITKGSDGAIYVSASAPCIAPDDPRSVVFRIDTSGTITNKVFVTDATRITNGPDGNLWITQGGATNAIARMTPAGAVTEFPLPTAGAEPKGIAAGNDGAIWFTEFHANKIGRITTSGSITEFAIPTARSGPWGIGSLAGECSTGHGRIWFTESTANKIGRIDF